MQEVTYESAEVEFSLPGTVWQILEEGRNQEIILIIPIGGEVDAYE